MEYKETKEYREYGHKMKIEVSVSLGGAESNGYNYFSFRCSIWEMKGDHWINVGGGVDHDSIAKHFSELRPFLMLHLSNTIGQPDYSVDNGLFFAGEYGKDVLMRHMRLTDEEADSLMKAKDDKDYFEYLLWTSDAPRRWKDEADRCIAFLEHKTGSKFVNRFSPDKEKVWRMSQEKIDDIEGKIASGYYTDEMIDARRKEKERNDFLKREKEIIDSCEREIEELNRKRTVKLYVLRSCLPLYAVDNFIYYDHTNKGVFNWRSNDKKITQEEFVDFLNSIGNDYDDKLPEGIKFEIK